MKAKMAFFIAVGAVLIYWMYKSMKSKTSLALAGVAPTLASAGSGALATSAGRPIYITGGLPLTPANKGSLAYISPQPYGTMNPSTVTSDTPQAGMGKIYNAVDDPGIQQYMMDQYFQDTATG